MKGHDFMGGDYAGLLGKRRVVCVASYNDLGNMWAAAQVLNLNHVAIIRIGRKQQECVAMAAELSANHLKPETLNSKP